MKCSICRYFHQRNNQTWFIHIIFNLSVLIKNVDFLQIWRKYIAKTYSISKTLIFKSFYSIFSIISDW